MESESATIGRRSALAGGSIARGCTRAGARGRHDGVLVEERQNESREHRSGAAQDGVDRRSAVGDLALKLRDYVEQLCVAQVGGEERELERAQRSDDRPFVRA